MSDATARLALPMIVPGQAQKEMSHNEALVLIDAAVQASVLTIGADAPPSDPVAGQCWIIGDAPTGAWTGHPGEMAAWTAGGWRFVPPTPGFRIWVTDTGIDARFVGDTWIQEPAAADPIADPTGGATIDSQSRTAIAAVLQALRHHNLIETP